MPNLEINYLARFVIQHITMSDNAENSAPMTNEQEKHAVSDHEQQQPDADHKFSLDRAQISTATLSDDTNALHALGVVAYDQSTFEAGALTQIDQAAAVASTSKTGSEPESEQSAKFANLVTGSDHALVKHGHLTPLEARIEDKQTATKSRKRTQEQKTKQKEKQSSESSESEYEPSSSDAGDQSESPSESGTESEYSSGSRSEPGIRSGPSRVRTTKRERIRDDRDDRTYLARLKSVRESRAKQQLDTIKAGEGGVDDGDADWSHADHVISDNLIIPKSLWNKLYTYQQTGVRWLWELHQQNVGGIMGDEMGLGKTIQCMAFLEALAHSELPVPGFRHWRGLGPVLIICPTTLMHQWVRELHKWTPRFRVVVMHGSAKGTNTRKRMVHKVLTDTRPGNILITSYNTFMLNKALLQAGDWHYVVLDEGHKIRNPDAQITLCIKQLRTPHRIILTGSPMQNNLRELWSLFDFVYPGLLGGLQVFTEELGVPITQGGYANASRVQVHTAYKCACVLRDTIAPYLLRRMKSDVQQTLLLPDKHEQVLFCRITDAQRSLYQQYLQSRQCERILNGAMDAFVGLILLRKLCNHPDLVTGGPNKRLDYDLNKEPDKSFGHECRAGKMLVLKQLLTLWKEQHHRVLLFTQSQQMLTILQKFLTAEDHEHLYMSGKTSVASRQTLVKRFNEDKNVFVFLLTTRVGGLGLNLTGADRVLIYDPDWNPSTDVQARERCWRIGQTKDVTIYRLLCAGTIEEKMYHRQIFKQFLTNRVLQDPRQRRFFKTNDLHELFTLSDDRTVTKQGTETAAIFAGTDSEVTPSTSAGTKQEPTNFFDQNETKEKTDRKSVKMQKTSDNEEDIDYCPPLSEERRQQLRQLAKKLSERFMKRRAEQKQRTQQPSSSKSAEVKQKKKKRKRRKQSVMFDNNVEIDGLVEQKTLNRETSVVEKEEKQQTQGNDYVLHCLLKKTGVHSALRHDNIMSLGDADYALVEQEAQKVADAAASKLVQSRTRMHDGSTFAPKRRRFGVAVSTKFVKRTEKERDDTNVDDGTTHNSAAPSLFAGHALLANKDKQQGNSAYRPSRSVPTVQASIVALPYTANQPAVQSSSADILAAIQKRKGPDSEGTPTTTTRHDELMDRLRCFIATQNGAVSTQTLVTKFQTSVSRRDTAPFRAMLRRLCVFDKAKSQWTLKPEFR